MSGSQAQKQVQILDAARALFLRNGLRGTSMEAIAEAAGVAKPTLYKYFAGKQAVFDALLAQVFEEMRSIAEKALAGDGTVPERVAAALAGKHKYVFRLLEGSPHAEELYFAPKRGKTKSLAELDHWLKAEIVKLLASEGRRDAAGLAALLIATAQGIGLNATQAAEIGPAIRFTVSRLTLMT